MSVIELRVLKRWQRVCDDCGWAVPEGHEIASAVAHHWTVVHGEPIAGWVPRTEVTMRRGELAITDLDQPLW